MQNFIQNEKQQSNSNNNPVFPSIVSQRILSSKPVIPSNDLVGHYFASVNRYEATREKIEKFHAAAAKSTCPV